MQRTEPRTKPSFRSLTFSLSMAFETRQVSSFRSFSKSLSGRSDLGLKIRAPPRDLPSRNGRPPEALFPVFRARSNQSPPRALVQDWMRRCRTKQVEAVLANQNTNRRSPIEPARISSGSRRRQIERLPCQNTPAMAESRVAANTKCLAPWRSKEFEHR